MYSYLALVQDDPTVQVVNNAQRAYVEHFIQGDPDTAELPVLSAAAPSKLADAKRSGQLYRSGKGDLTFRNAADLYLYPNTLVVMKVNGAQVKVAGCSAGQFNQIDPQQRRPQALLNWNYRTYNFDVIDGVNYQIDVTQPARYDEECQLINPQASRIKDLTGRADRLMRKPPSRSLPITTEHGAASSPAPAKNILRFLRRMKTARWFQHGLARKPDRRERCVRRRITTGGWLLCRATCRWIFALKPRRVKRPLTLSHAMASGPCAICNRMRTASPFIALTCRIRNSALC